MQRIYYSLLAKEFVVKRYVFVRLVRFGSVLGRSQKPSSMQSGEYGIWITVFVNVIDKCERRRRLGQWIQLQSG